MWSYTQNRFTHLHKVGLRTQSGPTHTSRIYSHKVENIYKNYEKRMAASILKSHKVGLHIYKRWDHTHNKGLHTDKKWADTHLQCWPTHHGILPTHTKQVSILQNGFYTPTWSGPMPVKQVFTPTRSLQTQRVSIYSQSCCCRWQRLAPCP